MPAAQWSFPTELAPFGVDDEALKALEEENVAYLDLSSADSDDGAVKAMARTISRCVAGGAACAIART